MIIESGMATAFDPLGLGVDLTLDSVGAHKERSGKEEHLYNPLTIHNAAGSNKNRKL